MPLFLKATVRFLPDKRSEFAGALDSFVPNIERSLGWKHHGLHWNPDEPMCTLEWELTSAADLERAQEFDQSPGEKPEWYTRANEFVLGERMVLQDENGETCVMNTLD